MMWEPGEDADAITEAALANVGMDGMLIRCPLAVFDAFGLPVKPLRRGEIEGVLDLDRGEVRLDMSGEREEVLWRAAHEGGHLVMHLAGIKAPHSEALASCCGRAIVIGERSMQRALDECPYLTIPGYYQSWLPWRHAARRRWEVQVRRMRWTG